MYLIFTVSAIHMITVLILKVEILVCIPAINIIHFISVIVESEKGNEHIYLKNKRKWKRHCK